MMARRKNVPGLVGADDYMARDDLATITRAHEICCDTPRFKRAKEEAERQRHSLERIARLEAVNLSQLPKRPPHPKREAAAPVKQQREVSPVNKGIPRHDRKKMPKSVDQSNVGKL